MPNESEAEFAFSGVEPDPNSVEGIFRLIEQMEHEQFRQTDVASESLAKTSRLTTRIGGIKGEVSIQHEAISKLSFESCRRTHDLEFVLNQRGIQQLSNKVNLQEIAYEIDGKTISFKPLEESSVHLLDDSKEVLVFERLFELSGDGISPKKFRLQVNLGVAIVKNSIRVFPIIGTRFQKVNGESADPFNLVPVGGGLRTRIRKKFEDEVRSKLESTMFNLSSYLELPNFSSNPPHGFFVKNLQLHFVARNFPKRREAVRVAGPLPNYRNRGIRIKKDYLKSQIESKIKEVRSTATVQNIEFRHGHVLLRVGETIVKRRCHVKVTVTTWLEYHLTLSADYFSRLYANLWISDGNIHVKAERCWPKCDDIVAAAMRKARAEVDKIRNLQFALGKLPEAIQTNVVIEPYGIYLMQEGTL